VALEEGRGGLRASHADREQAIVMLKAAFAHEQLDKAEFETRAGQALASRSYAELAATCRRSRWPSRSPGSST